MRRVLGSLAVLAAGIGLTAPAALASPAGPAGLVRPAGPAPSASPGAGSFGIRLVDAPVSEEHNPRAWEYIIDSLHPGTVIHRRIAVQNKSSKVAHIKVYADAATIKDGSFIGGPGQARNELTSWASVSRPALTLAPGAAAVETATIRVPAEATRGERYAVIWAQETSRVQRPNQFSVVEVNRVGVRVYLAVGRGGALPTNFSVTEVTSGRDASGAPQVIARVRNTGQRAIDLLGTLKLFDGPGGASAGPFRFGAGLTLAPGQSGLMLAVLSKATPSGTWHVTVTMKSGITTRQSTAVITVTGLMAAGFSSTEMGIFAGVVGVAVLVLAWFVARGLGLRVRLRRA